MLPYNIIHDNLPPHITYIVTPTNFHHLSEYGSVKSIMKHLLQKYHVHDPFQALEDETGWLAQEHVSLTFYYFVQLNLHSA